MESNNDNNSSATATATLAVQSPCAACKHQRKKCGQDCRLAKYFPADRNREFQAVHRVFGVSNVTKIVHGVNDEESRLKVVDSLIWEAYWRQKDPVLGPYGEYKRICQEFKRYKSQTLMQNYNQNQMQSLQEQEGMIHGSASHPLMEWNNNEMNNSGNEQLSYNNNHDNGNNLVDNGNNSVDNGNNSVVDVDGYGYAPHFLQSPKNLKQEREISPVGIPLQQQQQQRISNGFSQQYYVPGQFS